MAAGKRRDQLEIIAEILKVAGGGEIMTHIIFKTAISYFQFNDYIKWLVKRGFLKKTTIKGKRRPNKMYRTTEKGMDLLDRIEYINKLCAKKSF